MPSVHIHLLKHPTKVGDNNQLEGTLMAFKHITYFSTIVKERNCTDQAQLTELQDEINSAGNVLHVILSSGEQGLTALQQLKFDRNKSVLSCWSAHQQFPGIKSCLDKLDVIALPKYAIDATLRESLPKEITLVETMGVAHAVTLKSIESAFLKWQARIEPHGKYLAVVLGGDADVNGEKKFFNHAEAKLLAKYVSVLAKRHSTHVLITDSPRTGEGVADSFKEILNDEQISYQYFPFVRGEPSAYQPILGALSDPDNKAIVTADSQSMVIEMNHVLKCTLLIANVGSTDKVFLDYVTAAGLGTCVIKLNLERRCCEVEEINKTNKQVKSAGLAIASVIKQHLRVRLLECVDNYSASSHFKPRTCDRPDHAVTQSAALRINYA